MSHILYLIHVEIEIRTFFSFFFNTYIHIYFCPFHGFIYRTVYKDERKRGWEASRGHRSDLNPGLLQRGQILYKLGACFTTWATGAPQHYGLTSNTKCITCVSNMMNASPSPAPQKRQKTSSSVLFTSMFATVACSLHHCLSWHRTTFLGALAYPPPMTTTPSWL